MSWFERFFSRGLSYWLHSKTQRLHWQREHQQHLDELRMQQLIAQRQRIAELKKQSQQLAHELELMAAQHDMTLAMTKNRCAQDLKDYQHYLYALEQLKQSLCQTYTNLPVAVALTIHHHAKQLLNQMWAAEDYQQRVQLEMRLLQLMTAVHEDNQLSLQGSIQPILPEKTLALLSAETHNPL